MPFQIHALPATRFPPLFELSAEELANAGAVRKTVDAKPGYPCRVSLVDAEVGEQVILLNYEHQSAETPFRASHAIYVREHAERALPEVGTVPDVLASLIISVRAFDDRHYMVDAVVVDGTNLQESIESLFQDPVVSYLQLHNAGMGCYVARVTRS